MNFDVVLQQLLPRSTGCLKVCLVGVYCSPWYGMVCLFALGNIGHNYQQDILIPSCTYVKDGFLYATDTQTTWNEMVHQPGSTHSPTLSDLLCVFYVYS